MKLEDIMRQIENHSPPPDPFNGATHLFLAKDVLERLSPHLTPELCAFDLARLEITVSPLMEPGTGLGVRPWREGDDPELRGLHVPTFILSNTPDGVVT